MAECEDASSSDLCYWSNPAPVSSFLVPATHNGTSPECLLLTLLWPHLSHCSLETSRFVDLPDFQVNHYRYKVKNNCFVVFKGVGFWTPISELYELSITVQISYRKGSFVVTVVEAGPH